MNSLFVTLIITFIIIVICLSLLGISWIFTGKSKLRANMCGKIPSKQRNDNECGTDYSCSICGKDEPEEKK